jgi:nucleotide-binding universal stress UspA family protein
MLQRILVGLAGTRYAEAVTQTALEIARSHGAEITAVTAVDLATMRNVGPVPPGAGQAAKELREHRLEVTRECVQQSIEQFEARCQKEGVAFQILREEREQPFDFLISQSRYHDLTVLSLRGIFEYDLSAGDETDASLTLAGLISGGVRPILAVPSEARHVKRVFAAYSGSVESAATLRRFLQLRPHADIELRVATFEMDPSRSENLLAEVAKYCRKCNIEPDLIHFPADAQEHLLREAEAWQADLIVLGNSAKNLLLRRMLGETALKVIREAEVPLFLSQ